MCGIVGYTGYRNAKNVIVDCLKRLEYRGYDSAGIAILNKNLSIFKEIGEIKNLEDSLPKIKGNAGLGHTRWATHGGVSKKNAHPHVDCNKKIAVVHNGIVENFKVLKEELKKKGHKFSSETDTEVIVHLIEEEYKGNIEEAALLALKKIKGSYALAIICKDEPNKIIGIRKESPLVIGVGDNENFIASDIPAFLKYTNRVIYLDDNEMCVATPNSIKIFDENGNEVMKEERIVEWNIEDAEKSGFPHFMLKEIHEQPVSISQAMRGRISEMEPWITLGIENFEDIDSITMVACGTSFYAAMVGKYIIEEITKIPVFVELASEYRYFGGRGSEIVIAITQSGETADTLAAIKKAKAFGCKTIVITNCVGSTAARLADDVILTHSGPEIGVAATKTFTSQIIILLLLALKIAIVREKMELDKVEENISNLKMLPHVVTRVLEKNDEIKEIASKIKDSQTVFFIGRGINYPLSLEGALKLKEISYIHAEGFAAGELKHGPFALLTEKTPVVAIVTRDKTYEKTLSNIGEIKARNSPVIAIVEEGDEESEKYADFILHFPSIPFPFSCIPIAVILQLLAYHVANLRNCSIDKPRNLAKSVTVE